MSLASEYDLPVKEENITLSQRSADRIVNVTYTTPVPFLPAMVTQPITFNPSASVRLLNPPRR